MFETTETDRAIIRTDDGRDAVSVLGGRTRFLVRPDEVGGAYAVLEQTIPAGHGPPLHVHRHETEIFYVLEGTFEFRVGDDSLVAGPGACAACPRDIPHTFKNVGDTPARLHLTVFPGHFGKYFEEVAAIDDADLDAVHALIARYEVEIIDGPDGKAVDGHHSPSATHPSA